MASPLYLVAYDVSEPRRLQRAGHIIKDFASGGQKSAYECYLSAAEKRELKQRMRAALNLDEDSLLFIRLPADCPVAFLGVAEMPPESGSYYFG